MALVLSSAQSSVLEPHRKNRWIIQFSSIPGGGNAEELAFVAHTSTIPGISFTETEYPRLNEKFYVAGKPTWDSLSMTFYDFINGDKSSGDILYNWSQRIYNPITGQMGFKKQYTTTATLAQLDPAGGVARLWNIFYIWPSSVKFGEGVDYGADDINECNVTFRYDFSIKGIDNNTTP
jgi:hypothetical protein